LVPAHDWTSHGGGSPEKQSGKKGQGKGPDLFPKVAIGPIKKKGKGPRRKKRPKRKNPVRLFGVVARGWEKRDSWRGGHA